jgi:hypothetical protein
MSACYPGISTKSRDRVRTGKNACVRWDCRLLRPSRSWISSLRWSAVTPDSSMHTGGRSICDFVGRFETLERDLRTVLTRIGIDFAGAYQPELRHQTQAAALCGRYYTPDLRARVYGLYRRDFELFAYPA